jgi:hypothetical protein
LAKDSKSNKPLSLAGSQVHAVQAKTVGRAVVWRKKDDPAVTSPKGRQKTGSNRNEIGVVPVRLPAMKGRRDKNLFRKGRWVKPRTEDSNIERNMEEYSIK